MTFTYTPSSPTDLTRVRYHVGDTVEASALFTDEEINFVISEEGTYQRAVISLLENMLAKIAREPDFRADWMSVSHGTREKALRSLISEKRKQFDIRVTSATAVHSFRFDSLQTEAPDADDW